MIDISYIVDYLKYVDMVYGPNAAEAPLAGTIDYYEHGGIVRPPYLGYGGTCVYIASSYSNGDSINDEEVLMNAVKRQMLAGSQLHDAGIAYIAPLLSHYTNRICPRPNADWLELDMVYVSMCNALLRLPGESEGADKEMIRAMSQLKPVYTSVNEAILHKDSNVRPLTPDRLLRLLKIKPDLEEVARSCG